MTIGARALTCPRCGGAIPLAQLQPLAHCPYCTHHWQLSRDEHRELAHYQSHVRDRLSRANQAYGTAAQWDYWYGGDDAKAKSHPLVPVIVFGTLFIAIGSIAAIVPALGLPNEIMNVVMPVASFGVFFVVIGGYLVWFYAGRSRKQKSAIVQVDGVNCPSCGAPHVLVPGQPLERCRYCHAALVPDRGAIAAVHQQADHALLQAEIAEQRALRRGMAGISRSGSMFAGPYLVLGTFLPMTAGAALVATGSWVFSDHELQGLLGVFAVWVLALLNIGLILAVVVYRRARRARWRARVAEIGSRLSTPPLSTIEQVNAWLDRHWAGSTPIGDLFPGYAWAAIAGTASGYPMQLMANPVALYPQYPGFVVARIAAWLPNPGPIQANGTFHAARRAFEAQGFELRVERAGLVARADATAVDKWGKIGNPVALADAVSAAARAAHEVGAPPVDVGF